MSKFFSAILIGLFYGFAMEIVRRLSISQKIKSEERILFTRVHLMLENRQDEFLKIIMSLE